MKRHLFLTGPAGFGKSARIRDALGPALAYAGGFVTEYAVDAQGPENEMLLCYAIVNTLCSNTGMKRVCFFFEGEQTEEIAGRIYWAGEFLFNPEL